jgi:hypothetical protein
MARLNGRWRRLGGSLLHTGRKSLKIAQTLILVRQGQRRIWAEVGLTHTEPQGRWDTSASARTSETHPPQYVKDITDRSRASVHRLLLLSMLNAE